ncbi:MAG: glycosyltransferase family 9 protein [Armatimonadetes bacterium]|nr:glycosyltransferase family 9 protein [Armatimonadota bacterium]
MPEKVRNIVFFQVDNIGDILMATPALRALHRRFPEARMIGLVNQFGKELLEHNPDVDQLIVVDHRRMINSVKAEAPWEFVRHNSDQIRLLKQYRCDVGVSLVSCGSPAGAAQLLFSMAGVPYRVGLQGCYAHLLNQHTEDTGKHRAEISLDVVRLLGADDEGREINLPLSEEDSEFARQYWQEHRVPEGAPVVALNPGGNLYRLSRRWMPEGFVEIGDRLRDRYGATILLIGGPDETALTEEIAARMQYPPLDVAGRTTLRQLAALLADVRMLVTNDTGSLHIADAVGTQTVAIFGPTDPKRIAPRSGRCTVVRLGLPCSPCYRGNMERWPTCPYGTPHPCMSSLSPEVVLSSIDSAFNRSGYIHHSLYV